MSLKLCTLLFIHKLGATTILLVFVDRYCAHQLNVEFEIIKCLQFFMISKSSISLLSKST